MKVGRLYKRTMDKWMVYLVDADEYDPIIQGNNFAFIIDENKKEIKFDDSITMRGSSESFMNLIDKIFDDGDELFVQFITSKLIPNYSYDFINKNGLAFWTRMLNNFDHVVSAYGGYLDYGHLAFYRTHTMFGGDNGLSEIMIACTKADDIRKYLLPICNVCKNCKCDHNFNRKCKSLAVKDDQPVHTKFQLKSRYIDLETDEYFTSDIDTILKNAEKSEMVSCPAYQKRFNPIYEFLYWMKRRSLGFDK